MKIAFHTLGCKVNQYETEALKEQFSARGYQLVDDKEYADVYVINTCTVTSLADRKSRQIIRRMKRVNPDSLIAVTGCYAQISPEEVAAIPEVDLVAGTNEKGNLLRYVEEKLGSREGSAVHVLDYDQLTEYEETGVITSMDSKTRAFIKIQEGCNRFCSYCIIPYARGPVRSRGLEEILEEAGNLIEKGFKELVLTGINTALYGMESDETSGVEQIIRRLNELPGDFRIRLSSLEPTVVNKEYVRKLFAYDKLCHHLHLSVQSGSNRILSDMNRHYTREEYLEIVTMLREFDPHYGISTDIIAGFPGETEKDFEDSMDLIEQVKFCRVHAFGYSRRQGTKAWDMKGQVAPEVKNRRTSLLIEAGNRAARGFFLGMEGEERTVLTEERDGAFLTGYTDNYVKAYIEEAGDDQLNKFLRVRVIIPYKDGVKCSLIP